MVERGKSENSGFPLWLKICIFCMCFLEVLFLVVIYILVLLGVVSGNAFWDATLSMTMSNIVSFIGIAVAVWAGLNISIAVQRKELSEAIEKATTAEKKADEAKDIAEGAKPKLESINDWNTKIEAARKTEFLIELEKMSYDELSKWLFKQFQQREGIDPSPCSWADLVALEREFRLVDISYREERMKDDELFVGIVNGCTDRFGKFKMISTDPFLKAYATVRLGDLFYYKGKKTHNNEAFRNAIEKYKDNTLVMAFWGSDCMDFDLLIESLKNHKSDKANLAAYFCNTIGDAYKESKNYKEAVQYCEMAVSLSDQDLDAMETYERNLGAALEMKNASRLNEDGVFNEIMSHYENAARVLLKEKNVQVRASLLDKHINCLMGLPCKVDLEVDETNNHFRTKKIDDLVKELVNVGNEEYWRIEDSNEQLGDIASTAISMFPRNSLGYLYDAIFWRNNFILSKATNEDEQVDAIRVAKSKLANQCPRPNKVEQLILNDLEEVLRYIGNATNNQGSKTSKE